MPSPFETLSLEVFEAAVGWFGEMGAGTPLKHVRKNTLTCSMRYDDLGALNHA